MMNWEETRDTVVKMTKEINDIKNKLDILVSNRDVHKNWLWAQFVRKEVKPSNFVRDSNKLFVNHQCDCQAWNPFWLKVNCLNLKTKMYEFECYLCHRPMVYNLKSILHHI